MPLVLLLAFATYLQAHDDKPVPFGTTSVSIGIGRSLGTGDLNDYWAAGLPIGLAITMPFYFGRVEAGTQILPFRARQNRVPDFVTQFFFIGWGLWKPLTKNLSVFGGIRLGGQIMTFSGAAIYGRHETELGTEASLGLALKIFSHWMIQTTVRHQSVHTQIPMNFDIASVSVSRHLATPDWLRIFLE